MVYFWMIWGTPILEHHHTKIEYPNYWMANTENTFKPVVPQVFSFDPGLYYVSHLQHLQCFWG